MTTDFTEAYARFISDSPSSFHAAQQIVQALGDAGFSHQDEAAPWAGHDRGYVVRGGAVIAWQLGYAGSDGGFRIVGSHTDSPSFKVKPTPGSSAFGFGQVNVEVYGGPLLNSWLNRDLGIAGIITDIHGEAHLVKTPAIMVIPQTAPHLDRSVNDRLELSRQADYHPIWALGAADLAGYLADSAGIAPEEIAGHDLFAYDVQAPAVFGGADGDAFFAAGRQDNLSSVFASLKAFLTTTAGLPGEDIAVFAAFDHEEVGSSTYAGAAGPFLENTLRRIAESLGAASYDAFAQMLARSSCISADAGHSINPNMPAKHDPNHQVALGAGPLLKVNANQRYATEAKGSALWRRAAACHGVATQTFVSNNDVPCGSTIGPLTATRLGMTTVDVGIPLLSMHSVREISCPADVLALAKVCEGYWVGA
ncbi:M18 family aminopeptidase [Trueperella bialowiezensis]|uniref:M18 family aminopeptidase n=1 Tax=Trueperella bialowiezensis TaxID=312285 RepID=A0A3S4X578_9ACTO|nr:M18 family aminopeptidase [Trueperella bialowiezensis]VEI12958.1 Probable M18 family aminopeptidase 2 [Trueperella bialowiezensis]